MVAGPPEAVTAEQMEKYLQWYLTALLLQDLKLPRGHALLEYSRLKGDDLTTQSDLS